MDSLPQKYDKETIFENLWNELGMAAHNRKHAWHIVQLASYDGAYADNRSVVLRDVDKNERSLVCHTDIRSPKVKQIQNHPDVCWLAYEPEQRVQVRLYATATIHNQNAYAHERWMTAGLSSRLCYANKYAPSVVVEKFSDLENNTITSDNFDETVAEKNFAVIRTYVYRIDWLYLKHRGHIRAAYEYLNGQWVSNWLAP